MRHCSLLCQVLHRQNRTERDQGHLVEIFSFSYVVTLKNILYFIDWYKPDMQHFSTTFYSTFQRDCHRRWRSGFSDTEASRKTAKNNYMIQPESARQAGRVSEACSLPISTGTDYQVWHDDKSHKNFSIFFDTPMSELNLTTKIM